MSNNYMHCVKEISLLGKLRRFAQVKTIIFTSDLDSTSTIEQTCYK